MNSRNKLLATTAAPPEIEPPPSSNTETPSQAATAPASISIEPAKAAKPRARRHRRQQRGDDDGDDDGPDDVAADDISGFCRRWRMSRSFYFKIRAQGLGPREMRVGTRVLITRAAQVAWQRMLERDEAVTTDV